MIDHFGNSITLKSHTQTVFPFTLLSELFPRKERITKSYPFTPMNSHNNLSDSALEAAFYDCTLPPALFDHEAHLRLAWIHIKRYGLAQAILNLQIQIQRYATSLGAADKYHSTLTVAAIYTVDHFMQRCDAGTFAELLLAFPRLKTDFWGLITSHYSEARIQSAEAKKAWLAPDLLAYPPT